MLRLDAVPQQVGNEHQALWMTLGDVDEIGDGLSRVLAGFLEAAIEVDQRLELVEDYEDALTMAA